MAKHLKKQGPNNEPGHVQVDRILNNKTFFDSYQSVLYMRNLFRLTDKDSRFALKLCESAEQTFAQENDYDFPAKATINKKTQKKKSYYTTGKIKKVDPQDWDNLNKYFEDKLADLGADEKNRAPTTQQKNLERLANYLGLDETGKDLLTLISVLGKSQYLEFVINACSGQDTVPAGLARMLGKEDEFSKIKKLLSSNGPLASNGLIYTHDYLPKLDPYLNRKLHEGELDEDDLVGNIIGRPIESDLDITDFDYMGNDLERLVRLVGEAAKNGQHGINILLYGPPGVGKTELSMALAKELEMKLYAVGEDEGPVEEFENADGEMVPVYEPQTSYEKRMPQLKRAQALLENSEDSILLFDEMEDLLLKGTDTSKAADTESKIELNRLLENNPVVTIWTANDPQKFHKAVLQRFAFSIQVNEQPSKVRETIWKKHIERNGLDISSEETQYLARKYEVAPRMIGNATRVAATMNGGLEDIEALLRADAQKTYGSASEYTNGKFLPKNYDLGLLNVEVENMKGLDEAVESLSERLRRNLPFSLRIKAAKGAGSSSLARYLGEQGAKDVWEVSLKELAKSGGFTPPETKIRRSFYSAADTGAFLVVRDAEYLNAVSEDIVEAFKEAVRTHEAPLAIIANKNVEMRPDIDHMFSHKMQMDVLKPEQAETACQVFFGRAAENPERLPSELVVADFDAVNRKIRQRYLPDEDVPEQALLDMLGEESQFRQKQQKSIGFKTSPPSA